jgi:hypothetical protein
MIFMIKDKYSYQLFCYQEDEENFLGSLPLDYPVTEYLKNNRDTILVKRLPH